MNVSKALPKPSIPTVVRHKRSANQAIRRERLAIAAVVGACILWGTSFAFGKVALQGLTVYQLVLMRFLVASAALIPVLARRWVRIQPRDWLRFLLIGFLAVPVTYLVQYLGLTKTTISRASLIIGAGPPLMALGGTLFFGERPGWRAWLAVVGSMLGIALVAGNPVAGGTLVGDSLVFLSILISVSWVLLSKSMNQRYGALTTTGMMLLTGTVTLIPFSLWLGGLPPLDLTGPVWASLLSLGIVCTALTFFLWNWGLERLPASKAGIYLNLEPLVGVVLGIVLFSESLHTHTILGGALVLLAGVDLARSESNHDGGR